MEPLRNYSSNYLGVKKKGNKFRAQITKNNVTYNLGTYNTEEEAALAYSSHIDSDKPFPKIEKKLKKSQYKGVSFRQNKWRARIYINKKEILIGNFNSEIEAAKAYNQKATEVYGKNAKLNDL